MPDAIFGPLTTGADIENAVRDTLKLWTPEYLAWIKRETGRQLQTPRSWVTTPQVDRWAEEAPPTVLMMSSGTAATPITEGDGSVRATYDLGLAVVTTARTEGDARELARLYAAVFVRILTQHRSLGGFANAVEWTGEEWDKMPDHKRHRQLAVGSATFVVEVENVLNVRMGPSVPREDPTPAQPDDPAITDATVTLDPEEVTP